MYSTYYDVIGIGLALGFALGIIPYLMGIVINIFFKIVRNGIRREI